MPGIVLFIENRLAGSLLVTQKLCIVYIVDAPLVQLLEELRYPIIVAVDAFLELFLQDGTVALAGSKTKRKGMPRSSK